MNKKLPNQVIPPELRNPTGKGGFGDHPEHIGSGHWNKNNSFSYLMNYFKSISVKEFNEYEKTKPKNKRTMAEFLAYARVKKARADLKEFEVVANRTEGMPKQVFDIGSAEGLKELTDFFRRIPQLSKKVKKNV